MKIKIEIDTIELREHIVQTIAKAAAKAYERENGRFLETEVFARPLREKTALELLKRWGWIVWPEWRKYKLRQPKHLKK